MNWSRLIEVLIVVSLTSGGQLLFRYGMRGSNQAVQGFDKLIMYIVQTPILWLAIALYGLSTLLWLRLLSLYPVSAIYPMVAIGYVTVTIGGVLLLHENVTIQGWIALGIICFGTILLAAAPTQT